MSCDTFIENHPNITKLLCAICIALFVVVFNRMNLYDESESTRGTRYETIQNVVLCQCVCKTIERDHVPQGMRYGKDPSTHTPKGGNVWCLTFLTTTDNLTVHHVTLG